MLVAQVEGQGERASQGQTPKIRPPPSGREALLLNGCGCPTPLAPPPASPHLPPHPHPPVSLLLQPGLQSGENDKSGIYAEEPFCSQQEQKKCLKNALTRGRHVVFTGFAFPQLNQPNGILPTLKQYHWSENKGNEDSSPKLDARATVSLE